MGEPRGSHATGKVHGPGGKFIRTTDQAELDAEAARLRSRSMGYREIGEQLGVTTSAAHRMVERALAAIPTEHAEAVRANELRKLDALERAALTVLEARHVTVSNGKLIYDGDEPLLDDAPVLNAIDRLLRVSESRRKLLGLDAPNRVEVVTLDYLDAEIARLSAQHAAESHRAETAQADHA